MFEEIQSLWHYYDPARPINVLMAGYSCCDKTYCIEREDSDIMQFEYVYDGVGTLEIEGQTLRPAKNDIYIVTRHSRHRYYSDAEHPWRKIWVAFDGPLIEGVARHQLPENTYLIRGCDISAHMEDILNLTRMYADDYDRITDEVTIFLLKIIIQIKNHLNSRAYHLPEQIKQRLDSGVEENLTLDRLCAEMNYTKNHIIKVFREFYGVTPYTYYRGKKIEVAKRYLDHTTLSVGEIAERLHFADSQYFAGCFKQIVGQTPTQYRKRPQESISGG